MISTEPVVIVMADARDNDDEIFIYMGGNQVVPHDVRRARIHRSVKIIPARAFQRRYQLIHVEFHDEIEVIGDKAFHWCSKLRVIKLMGVKIIGAEAFESCCALTDVEFGSKLETIEGCAFFGCNSLNKITMSSVRTVGSGAFVYCKRLSDVECGEGLETLEESAFEDCHELKRIVLPLKDNVITSYVFRNCPKLTTVDLVGGIHDTVASLHFESWRSDMMDEINWINQVLSDRDRDDELKTAEIREWIRSVIRKCDHYKLLNEAAALLELALWKTNLDDNEGGEREGVRTTRGSRKRARKEICVTSGASIVIKNVMPFLVLKS